MSFYEFDENSVFVNQMEANPYCHFFMYNQETIYNKDVMSGRTGPHSGNINRIDPGDINLYEFNVDRPNGGLIYPFAVKEGTHSNLKTVALASYRGDFAYGDEITGSYPLSASISKDYYNTDVDRANVQALRNTLDYYAKLSQHYLYSGSFGKKATQELGLISIPSIFYGSSMRKGTVNLKFYVTGSLIGHLNDANKNGELIEQVGTNSGSVGGVVLYTEGFMVLTGSWDISEGTHTEIYHNGSEAPTWVMFGATISGSVTCASSSFEMDFEGTTRTPTLTMLAHAPRAELNFSDNPTYTDFAPVIADACGDSVQAFLTSSGQIWQEPQKYVFNTISSSYTRHSASFEHQTFISSIGIYDEDKNLIGIARTAKPVRKKLTDEYTFKLKLDI